MVLIKFEHQALIIHLTNLAAREGTFRGTYAGPEILAVSGEMLGDEYVTTLYSVTV